MHRAGFARRLAAHAVDSDGEQFLVWTGSSGQTVGGRQFGFGEQGIQGHGTIGGGEQILLSGEGGVKFVGQGEPLVFGTRAEAAEGANDFLTGAFGSEGAFDQEVVEVIAVQDKPIARAC